MKGSDKTIQEEFEQNDHGAWPSPKTLCREVGKLSGSKETHMDRDQLRAVQAPLKQRYREDPESALITLRAEGSLQEQVACSISTGKALVEAGLHPATGGTGLQACSGDMLLQALVACAGVTLTAVATALGVKLRGGRVTAEGDLDVRGTLGIAKDAPVGFKQIRLRIVLDAEATPDEQARLLELTERYCVVYQTLCHGSQMSLKIEDAGE
jgi:uncharacterized OsmC-like protein